MGHKLFQIKPYSTHCWQGKFGDNCVFFCGPKIARCSHPVAFQKMSVRWPEKYEKMRPWPEFIPPHHPPAASRIHGKEHPRPPSASGGQPPARNRTAPADHAERMWRPPRPALNFRPPCLRRESRVLMINNYWTPGERTPSISRRNRRGNACETAAGTPRKTHGLAAC